MANVSISTVPENGLPIHRIELPGARALTVLVAFDAGARNERPEENGMAHFLEHLVFKGGEKYPTYKDVNETAERLGGVLNAYTSHDLVAFHITVRAESAPAAIDLLSDFVGRPRLDAEELDRERGVVIQEINRAYDQPSMVAEYLIDRAAFGEHPLGRTVLGPEENLRSFTREGILAFRQRRWAGARILRRSHGARVREHRRGRPPRGDAEDRPRRGDRPGRGDRRARLRHLRGGARGGRGRRRLARDRVRGSAFGRGVLRWMLTRSGTQRALRARRSHHRPSRRPT